MSGRGETAGSELLPCLPPVRPDTAWSEADSTTAAAAAAAEETGPFSAALFTAVAAADPPEAPPEAAVEEAPEATAASAGGEGGAAEDPAAEGSTRASAAISLAATSTPAAPPPPPPASAPASGDSAKTGTTLPGLLRPPSPSGSCCAPLSSAPTAGELSAVSAVADAVEATESVASLAPATSLPPDGSSSHEPCSRPSFRWHAVARAWARPSDLAITCAYDFALLALECALLTMTSPTRSSTSTITSRTSPALPLGGLAPSPAPAAAAAAAAAAELGEPRPVPALLPPFLEGEPLPTLVASPSPPPPSGAETCSFWLL